MPAWEYCTLEVAVKKASSNLSLNKIANEEGEYPVFGAKGFVTNISFFHQEEEYLAIIKDGAGIGRVSKYPSKSSILATMQYLVPNEAFDIDFIRYFLMGVDFQEYRTGSTIPHIYFKDYKSLMLPDISIPEQQSIVAILDQAFADIEKARANAEKNLKNARELFDSYLQQVFSQRGEGWVEKSLGEICDFLNGFAFKSSDALDESDVQLIRMGNLYKNILDLDRKPSFYPSEFADEYKKYLLTEGDLIISLTGTTGKRDYGFTVEVPLCDRKLLLNQRIAKITGVDTSQIEKKFLFRILKSPLFLDELYESANGTRQANLSTSALKNIAISFPSVGRQIELVALFDSIEHQYHDLEIVYKTKLSSLDELKKSLLQKAFSGELTKTEGMVA